MRAFVILALVAAACADVSHLPGQRNYAGGPDRDAQIINQEADVGIDGYKSAFQTSNGIQAEEQGQLKNPGREDEALQVQGGSSYTAPDGTPIQISFVADENGYRPQGAHLPTPPPTQAIPEYIARSLAYIAAHPPPPESPAQPRRF